MGGLARNAVHNSVAASVFWGGGGVCGNWVSGPRSHTKAVQGEKNKVLCHTPLH